MEKVEIAFESRGNFGAFTAAEQCVDRFGRKVNHATSVMQRSFNGLAASLDNKLGVTISDTFNVVGELAKGGLWEIAGMAAVKSIGWIVEKWQAAKKAAKEYAEIVEGRVVKSISDAAKAFRDFNSGLARSMTLTKENVAARNSGVDLSAQRKAASVRDEYRGRIERAGTAEERDRLAAERAYREAKIAAAASAEKSANDQFLAAKDVRNAEERVAKAKEMQAKTAEALAEIEGNALAGWLKREEQLKNYLAIAKKEHGNSYDEHRKSYWYGKVRDTELAIKGNREENKDAAERLKKAQEDAAAAEKAVAEANDALTSAKNRSRMATDAAAKAELSAGQAVKDAATALNMARKRQAAAAERAADAEGRQKDREKIAANAERHGLKADKYVALYDKLLNDRKVLTRTGALAAAQAEIARRVKERGEAEARLADAEKSAADKLAAMDAEIVAAKNGLAALAALQDAVKRGREADPGHDYALDENGNVITAHDARRALRAAEREDARAERRRNAAERLAAKEDARAEGLFKKMRRGFRLTDSEKNFMRDWRDRRRQAEDAERRKKEIDDLQKRRDEAAKKMQGDVAAIRKSLEEATKI